MTVKIIRRDGMDDGEVVARFEEGQGFTEAEEGLRWASDSVYEEYTEEMVLEEFDGPDLFAVALDTTQKSLGDYGGDD